MNINQYALYEMAKVMLGEEFTDEVDEYFADNYVVEYEYEWNLTPSFILNWWEEDVILIRTGLFENEINISLRRYRDYYRRVTQYIDEMYGRGIIKEDKAMLIYDVLYWTYLGNKIRLSQTIDPSVYPESDSSNLEEPKEEWMEGVEDTEEEEKLPFY